MKQPNPGWAQPSRDAPEKEAQFAYESEQEASWAADGMIVITSKTQRRRPAMTRAPWPMDFFTAHRLGRIGPREEKAVRLLSGIVSEDELEVYFRIGRLPSEGSEGGRYHLSRTGLDYEVDDMDEPLGGWCIHHGHMDQAGHHIPATDDVYARRMLVMTNELQYRKTAIWRPEAVEREPVPIQDTMADAQGLLQNPQTLAMLNNVVKRGVVAVRHYNAGRAAEGDDVLRALLAPIVNSPLGDTLTSKTLKVSLRMLTILHDLVGGDAGEAIFAVAEAAKVRSVTLQTLDEKGAVVPALHEPGRTKIGDGPWRYDHEEHWGDTVRARYPIAVQMAPNPPPRMVRPRPMRMRQVAFPPPMGPRFINPPNPPRPAEELDI